MKRLLPSMLLILALMACQWDKATQADPAPKKDPADYEDFKTSVTKHKAGLAGKPHSEVSNYFFHLVNDSLPAYWNGTPWDFYGMTRTPREGNIACGYFVTNTLADLGFKIQRVKLAQVASGDMIKVLCTDIKTCNGIKNFEAYMEKQPVNSVYIVGLDFHTGYIVKDASGSWFLHSNYIGRKGVMKEKIGESAALSKNKFFMIGSLSGNKKLLGEWAKG
ncbi:hypothetical protein OGH69_02345 [Flavobacterium sp. MFBS3-15]|uniref:hypothetical protein n=1 Tax=Flavobacterium sp. MFBS3-15 TaxID=2989816 RepID=UPI0022358498|nr:hypothetical protein [Flavobacterium sp. MFBS3-15]MCW4467790.1 hypothetical protein [Flavobacterium sp. MFBS3-15]